MLVLPPRYLITTPTTFIASIQVQAVIICLDIALAFYWIGISSSFYLETVAPLLCSKHCNDSLISLRIKSQAQSMLQGRPHVIWPRVTSLAPLLLFPLSSLLQGMASLPFLEPTSPVMLYCLFLCPLSFWSFFHARTQSICLTLSHYLQIFTQIVHPQ